MNCLTSIVLTLALAVSSAAAPQQPKTAKPAAKPAAKAPAGSPAEKLQEAILRSKTPDAVRLAAKNTAAVVPAIKALMDRVDLQITERKIEEAKSSLGAIDSFTTAYAAASKRKDIPQDAVKGRVLRLQGIQLSDQKEYAKAEGVLRKALDLSKSANDKVLEAGIHNNLGYSLQYQQMPGGEDKVPEAIKEFEAARTMAESQKDILRAGSYNFNLGMALMTARQYEAALRAYQRSAEQSQSASKTAAEARAVLYQGIALSRINVAGKEPINYFINAEKMFEKLGDDRNAGWSYWLMAEHTAYTGDFNDAARCAENAIPFLTKSNDKIALLRCYEFLTDMYGRFQGDEYKAKKEKYQKLAEEVRKQTSK